MRLVKSTFSVGIYNIILQKQFRKELKHVTAQAASRESRIQAAFEFLKSREDLGSRVSMQGATQDLKMRMDSILDRLKSENKGEKAHALAEGERLLKTLSSRVNRNLRIEVLKTAFKIVAVAIVALVAAGVVGSILSPAAPITLGVTALVGLGILAYKKKSLSKELYSLPAAVQPKINAQKFADANVKKQAKDFKGCLQDLKAAYPKSFQDKFPPKLQERLLALESPEVSKFEEAVELFEKCCSHLKDPQARVKYEEEGLELLSKIVVPESKDKKKAKGAGELAPADQVKLGEFLDYAYNNKIFNARLQSLTSPGAAETFAARYSHKTGMEKEFQKVLARMDPVVKAFEPLDKFADFVEQTCVDTTHRISILTKPGEATPEILKRLQGSVGADQKKLQTLEKSLKELSQIQFKSPFDKDYAKWREEFSQSVDRFQKDYLTQAKTVHQNKLLACEKSAQGSPERARFEKEALLIEKDMAAVERLTEDLKDSVPATDKIAREIEKVQDIVDWFTDRNKNGLSVTELFRGRGTRVHKQLAPVSIGIANLREFMSQKDIEDPVAFCAEISERLKKIGEQFEHVNTALSPGVRSDPEIIFALSEIEVQIHDAHEALGEISEAMKSGVDAVKGDFAELQKPASQKAALLVLLEESEKSKELEDHLKALEEYSHMSPYQTDFESFGESFVKHAFDFRHGYVAEAEKLIGKKQAEIEKAGEDAQLREKLEEEVKALKAAIKEVKERGMAIEKGCPHACLKMRAQLVDGHANALFGLLAEIEEERPEQLQALYGKVSNDLKKFNQMTPDKAGYEEWASSLRENVDKFHKAYEKACKKVKAEPELAKKLAQAKASLDDIVDPFIELNPDPAKSKKLALTMEPFHSRAKRLYNECVEDMPKERFALHEIELLETFAKLGETCPAGGGIATLKTLFDNCKKASETLGKLNTVIQATGNYESGDIVFRDEIRQRRYEGKPSFSKGGEGTRMQFLKELLGVFQGKGPWLVQPYFTGNLTHASIMNVQESALVAGEIVGSFDNTEPAFTEATYNVRYRPDFDKLVTEDGLKALQKLYKGVAKEKIVEDIKFRYQRELSSIMKSENEHFKKIQLSGLKAGYAWWNAKFREQVQRTDDTAIRTESEMFCSEFVATIMVAAFAKLQEKLRAEIGDENVKIFHDIVPTNVPFANVFPNRLEDFMKGFFKDEGNPPLVDLLVDPKIVNPRLQRARRGRAAA